MHAIWKLAFGFDRHPGIALLFNQGFPADLASMWEAGECDFAFSDKDVETDESESLPVYNGRLCLIGSPSLCAPLPDPVPIAAVADLPVVLDVRSIWAREQLESGFRKTGSKWTDLIECSSIEIRRENLVRGSRFCVVPIAQFNDEIAAGLTDHRGIDLPSFDRTVRLAGPRVEKNDGSPAQHPDTHRRDLRRPDQERTRGLAAAGIDICRK